jgi:phosphomannomutase
MSQRAAARNTGRESEHKSQLIVSVSGIRGIFGTDLTPALAETYAAALGTFLQGGKVVLGRDSRPSGIALRSAVQAGLTATGCDVVDIGIAPTPTVGLALRRLGAAGGIQISASHNPAEYNGLKLFGPQGSVLSAERGKQVQAIFQSGQVRPAEPQRAGKVTEDLSVLDWHHDRVRELIDPAPIRGQAFRVFLDANGGAGGPLGMRLLESLGCTVVPQGSVPDGIFAHPPEPTAENVQGIGPLIAQAKADIGCVLDPDADRLALLDETGRYIGEELTLALAVRFRLAQERGPVVINMSTSRLVEDIAAQFGCPCHRTAVGEANVVEKMRELSAVIGGEGNGGVIDPRVGGVRDPFIGMGLILSLMAQRGKKLSELVAELPVYHIVKDKYSLAPSRLPEVFALLAKRWPEAKVNRLDGLRLDWPDRWLHVRPSNTEPIVRVIAEAPARADAERLCREVGEMLR